MVLIVEPSYRGLQYKGLLKQRRKLSESDSDIEYKAANYAAGLYVLICYRQLDRERKTIVTTWEKLTSTDGFRSIDSFDFPVSRFFISTLRHLARRRVVCQDERRNLKAGKNMAFLWNVMEKMSRIPIEQKQLFTLQWAST